MSRRVSVAVTLFLALLAMASPFKKLWAMECAACGNPAKLKECSSALHSENFIIEGNSNPESARRAINALRNKMDDILAAEDFQVFHGARDDFDHLAKLVEKEKGSGEWRVTDAADKTLDLCDDALHPEDLDKN
jgi:hypothetical protein